MLTIKTILITFNPISRYHQKDKQYTPRLTKATPSLPCFQVLCELQMALAERAVNPRADVSRDVMTSEYRDMRDSETYRNLRDWLIFRDYMNGLEYIIQVLEHLLRGIES